MSMLIFIFFFFQAEDGIRDLVRSRGLGDVYKRQLLASSGIQKSTNGGLTWTNVLPGKRVENMRVLQGLSLIHI